MNVREFREWLNQFPDDTEVRVQVQEEPASYQAYGACCETDFDGDDAHYEYIDADQNQFISEGHPLYGRRILVLGESF